MPIVDEIKVLIGADTSGFTQGTTQAENSLSKFTGSMAGGVAVGNLISSAVISAGKSMLGFGEEAVQAAMAAEKTKTSFTLIMGGAQQATDFLDKLSTFAMNTPFDLPGLQSSAKKLINFGFTADQVIPVLTGVGDAVAAVGGGQSQIDAVTAAFGRMQSTGQVTSRDMMVMQRAQIPAWDILAKQIGVTVPEAMEMVKKKTISSTEVINALTVGMTSKYGAAMQAQMETTAGSITRINKSIHEMMVSTGQVILQFAGPAIKIFADIVEKLAEMATGFLDLAKKVGLMGALKEMPLGLKIALGALAGVIGGLLTVALVTAATAMAGLIAAAAPFIAIGAAIGAIGILVADNWNKVAPVVYIVAGAIAAAFIPSLLSVISLIPTAVGLLGIMVTELIATAAAAILPVLPFMIAGAAIGAVAYLIVKNWSSIGPFFTKLWTSLIAGVKYITSAVVNFFSKWWPEILALLVPFIGLPVIIIKNWNVIGPALLELWNTIKVDVSKFIVNMITFFLDLGSNINKIWMDMLNSVIDFAKNSWSTIGSDVSAFINSIVNFFTNFGTNVSTIWINFLNGVVSFTEGIWSTISSDVSSFINGVINFFSGLPGAINSIITNVVNFLYNGVVSMYNTAATWAAAIPGRFAQMGSDIIGYVSSYISSAGSSLYNGVVSMYNTAANWAAAIPGRFAQMGSEIVSYVSSYISSAAGYLYNGVVGMYNNVTGWIGAIPGRFSEMGNSIINYVRGLPGQLYNAAVNAATSFWNGFKKGLGIHSPSLVEKAFMSIGDQAQSTLNDLSKTAPKIQAIGSQMTNFQSAGARVSPTASMTGAGISRMTGSAAAAGTQAAMGGGATIQVAQMVVREEADVQKVAQALFRIQQDRLRGRGLKA